MTRAMALPKIINQEADAQAVMPAEEITRLFEGIVGNIQKVLLVFAVLIVIVAGIGMMVSIYNSMSERRHEIAVMRALGARRMTVMSIILLESILLSLGGGALGLLLGHGLVGLLAPSIMENTGVVVHALQFQPIELVLIPGLIAMASVVGYLPALIAYRTEVADSLSE
jgi:putative ABC transport system permease protein